MKHKSDDYKTIAVKYYLNNNDSMYKVCNIFNCKKSTLKDWIDRYKNTKHFTRKNRKAESYKINKEQVKYALNMIDRNEQLTMDELLIEMKQRYNGFDITSQHLGSIIRANNRTRKRTRHYHFPKERMKGISSKSILYYCKENNLTPYQVYEKLYEGEKITFDLLCGGEKTIFVI